MDVGLPMRSSAQNDECLASGRRASSRLSKYGRQHRGQCSSSMISNLRIHDQHIGTSTSYRYDVLVPVRRTRTGTTYSYRYDIRVPVRRTRTGTTYAYRYDVRGTGTTYVLRTHTTLMSDGDVVLRVDSAYLTCSKKLQCKQGFIQDFITGGSVSKHRGEGGHTQI